MLHTLLPLTPKPDASTLHPNAFSMQPALPGSGGQGLCLSFKVKALRDSSRNRGEEQPSKDQKVSPSHSVGHAEVASPVSYQRVHLHHQLASDSLRAGPCLPHSICLLNVTKLILGERI